MHWFELTVPAVFLIGGLVMVIKGIAGKIPDNPQVSRKSERIMFVVMGGVMIAIGGWLLYHWIFGPTER